MSGRDSKGGSLESRANSAMWTLSLVRGPAGPVRGGPEASRPSALFSNFLALPPTLFFTLSQTFSNLLRLLLAFSSLLQLSPTFSDFQCFRLISSVF